jgi:hypothetical protein
VLSGLAVVALGVCPALAQPAPKTARVGIVTSVDALDGTFRQSLRESGWIEGQNVLMERRNPRGRREEIPQAVAEILALKVDVDLPRFRGHLSSEGGRRPRCLGCACRIHRSCATALSSWSARARRPRSWHGSLNRLPARSATGLCRRPATRGQYCLNLLQLLPYLLEDWRFLSTRVGPDH